MKEKDYNNIHKNIQVHSTSIFELEVKTKKKKNLEVATTPLYP